MKKKKKQFEGKSLSLTPAAAKLTFAHMRAHDAQTMNGFLCSYSVHSRRV